LGDARMPESGHEHKPKDHQRRLRRMGKVIAAAGIEPE
jgi:hypothetical protein